MDNNVMSYLETLNYLKMLNKDQRLQLLEAGYEYLMSILTPACNDNETTARNLLIMFLSTFMMADEFLEQEDLDLLKEFFADELTEDQLIHLLRIADESREKIISGCESFIENNDEDFLDHIIILGIVVSSNNGEISNKEKELAVRYLKVLY